MTAVATRSTTTATVGVRSRARTPNGTVVAVVWVVAVDVVALSGHGQAATIGFLGGTLVLAVVLAVRRPAAAVELTLWLWLLAPHVRRVIDHATVYHPVSPVLSAAPLATLALLPVVRRLRDTGEDRACRHLAVVAVTAAFGFVVGSFRYSPSAAGAAFVLWGVPALFGMAVVALGRSDPELRPAIERAVVWAVLVTGVYGMVQFYAIPPWDAEWMRNAPIDSIGAPEPFAVRVFSTVNSPGPFAIFLAAALLYLTGSRHRLRVPAHLVGLAALGVSLVRAAWLAYAVGLLLVLVCSSARGRRTVLVSLALAAAVVVQIGGPLGEVLTDRVDEIREGRQDDSFVARRELHQQMLPVLADAPAGRGLGATGVVTRLTTEDQRQTDLAVLDSGLLDFGFSLGLPVGLLGLVALGHGWVAMAVAGLRRNAVPVGVLAAVLSVLLQMLAGNSVLGPGGVVCFLFWALARRDLLDARRDLLDARRRSRPDDGGPS